MIEPGTEEPKRVSVRVPFSGRVSGEGETFFFSDFANDLSSTGIGLSSIRMLEPEMQIKLRFQLPDSEEYVEVSGRVVWDARITGKSELGRRGGVEFREAKPGMMDRISRFVEGFSGTREAGPKS